jgi:hypothetical protein
MLEEAEIALRRITPKALCKRCRGTGGKGHACRSCGGAGWLPVEVPTLPTGKRGGKPKAAMASGTAKATRKSRKPASKKTARRKSAGKHGK